MSKTFEFGPLFDPEPVRDDVMKRGLIVRRANPLNCEIAIDRLKDAGITPTSEFYIRNHFDIPRLSTDSFRLRVGGAVDNPLELDMRELRAMPIHSLVATLECAGNGRQFFEPAIAGEPWEHGAVSTAKWTGVGLLDVVEQARVRSSAREILLRGADGGDVTARPGPDDDDVETGVRHFDLSMLRFGKLVDRFATASGFVRPSVTHRGNLR